MRSIMITSTNTQNHAAVVPSNSQQLTASPPKDFRLVWTPARHREHGSSHNLAINTETEFLYSIGSNTGRQQL
jgi:hypothetical protein